MSLEGIVSKCADAPYAPGNRRLWLKACTATNSWSSAGPIPKDRGLGSAPCCSPTTIPTGGLVYAGRAGTGIKQTELERLWRRLQPLAVSEMPLEVPPPRTTRFGSPSSSAACIGCGPSRSPR